MGVKIQLIEVTAIVGSTSTVFRFSSHVGYTTEPSDTPANAYYEPRIQQPGLIRLNMFDLGTTSGHSSGGYGDIVLLNTDGGLDSFVDYGFDGQLCVMKEGFDDQPYSTFATVLTGTIQQVEFSWSAITLRFKDNTSLLDNPVQSVLYLGNNVLPDGLEGVSDLKDKPKPRLFGRCFNITPICINTSRLIYQVNNGVVQSIAVSDNGVTLTASTNYASSALMLAALTDVIVNGSFSVDAYWTKEAGWAIGSGVATKTAGNTNRIYQQPSFVTGTRYKMSFDYTRTSGTGTIFIKHNNVYYGVQTASGTLSITLIGNSASPIEIYTDVDWAGSIDNVRSGACSPAGEYWTCLAEGMFMLGSSPAGTVTCDVVQGVAIANRTISQIVKFLAEEKLTAVKVAAQPLIDLDKAAPYEAGIYISDVRNYTDVLDELCNSVGAWWGFDNLGIFWCKQLQAPISAQALNILTQSEIKYIERSATYDSDKGVPAYRVNLDYNKNNTIMTSGLAGNVDSNRVIALGKEYDRITVEDTAVKALHSNSPEITLQTNLVSSTDALTEATRQLTLRKVRRDRIKIKASLAAMSYPSEGYWDDEAISEMPKKLSYCTGCFAGGFMHTVSGITTGSVKNYDIYRLNAIQPTGAWEKYTNIVTTFQNTSMAGNNQFLYILGGADNITGNATSKTYILDTSDINNVLNDSGITDLVTPRVRHCSFIYNNKLYVLGGTTTGGVTVLPVHCLDLANPTGAWNTASPLPDIPARRYSSTVEIYNGYLYVIGGSNISLKTTIRINLNSPVAWDSSYIPDMPVAKGYHASAIIDNYLYVFGGWQNDVNPYYRNDVYRINLDNPIAWEILTPMPQANAFLSSAIYGKSVYIYGGQYDDGTTATAQTLRFRQNTNPSDLAQLISLGRTILVKHPRYGYAAGRPMRIIGTETDRENQTITLDLWG